jgi:hypothetical protein
MIISRINNSTPASKVYPKLMINDDDNEVVIILATDGDENSGINGVKGICVYSNREINPVGSHSYGWFGFRDFQGELILKNG